MLDRPLDILDRATGLNSLASWYIAFQQKKAGLYQICKPQEQTLLHNHVFVHKTLPQMHSVYAWKSS